MPAVAVLPIAVIDLMKPGGGSICHNLARRRGCTDGPESILGVIGGGLAIAPSVASAQPATRLYRVPQISRVAVLTNPNAPSNATALKNLETAARSMNVQIRPVQAPAPDDFAAAFEAIKKDGAGALVVLGSSLFFAERKRIIELALQGRLASIASFREYAEAGGLMTYGADLRENFRRSAMYVDKILKGAKPSDLPIEQSTKLLLVVNLKTAKQIGITVPQSVLQRADEVIE